MATWRAWATMWKASWAWRGTAAGSLRGGEGEGEEANLGGVEGGGREEHVGESGEGPGGEEEDHVDDAVALVEDAAGLGAQVLLDGQHRDAAHEDQHQRDHRL